MMSFIAYTILNIFRDGSQREILCSLDSGFVGKMGHIQSYSFQQCIRNGLQSLDIDVQKSRHQLGKSKA
jgi:hypothetical protein